LRNAPTSINKFRRATARRLRANQTGAELTLWRELRRLDTKGTHKGRDEIRTRWLESEGYRVPRFWNNDLTESPDSVLETIYAALYGSGDV